MPRYIPRECRLWPADFDQAVEDLSQADRAAKVVSMYESGFAGVYFDPDERQSFEDTLSADGGAVYGDDLAHEVGFADAGRGKLSIPWLSAALVFPGCYPSAAQERGDCVSHGGAGAGLITIANEILNGLPDEVTGVVEGTPELPEQGIREGVVSSAFLWWTRRRGGDGWSCDTCASRILDEGLMLMRPYPELGIDLSDYNKATTSRYATSGPPSQVLAESKQHTIRKMVIADSQDSCRDLLASGYGMFDCGSQGFSKQRNEHGYSGRSGSWAHSMKVGGFDDRPVVHRLYGEPLYLIINNWGRWNSGPRDIVESSSVCPASLRADWVAKGIVNPQTGNILIPEGSFWTRWSDVKSRYRIALSGANGWRPPKNVNPWLAG